ncbi:MAG TPA: Smr/MutS family protein [Desulfomonilaceae bacterium]|nr:Smr/MutS family protein [Desulfomonilaceae bacterium]
MGDESEMVVADEEGPEAETVIELPIEGVLDLHTFSPREVGNLVDDYIEACLEADLFDIRIIHGKGKGVLRNRLHTILARHPLVENFVQAPPEAGGWGAVLVRLKRPSER